jgi:hypothetical protein
VPLPHGVRLLPPSAHATAMQQGGTVRPCDRRLVPLDNLGQFFSIAARS